MSWFLFLLSTKTLLLSRTELLTPYRAVYIVSGDAALYSGGSDSDVIAFSRVVHMMLANRFSQRMIRSSSTVGTSKDNKQLGAYNQTAKTSVSDHNYFTINAFNKLGQFIK